MSSVKLELNLKHYLHEKAQESRRNEIQACLMLVAGALFFVGGTLVNLKLGSDPKWFLIIPYHMSLYAGAILGLSLIISGLLLIVFGTIIWLYYHHSRRWFMEELRKTYKNELQKERSGNCAIITKKTHQAP